MSLANHTNVKENGGENENLTDYLKSMFNKLNNDIDLKQSQHQQSSSLSTTTKNNSIEKEIVNNDENIKSISNTSNIDERNQKQSSIDKQYVINKNQQIIIDKNNNNVIVDVAVTDDHDNDCNKIKLNNENDTSNKINGCDSITRTTTNDSHNDTKDDDSTLSSKSLTFTLTTSLHSYEIENNNNNDHKQDIENNKELKNFVNDQISKHNQSKNFVDHNNNNNNNNNEIIHNDDNVCDIGKQSKVQVPKEIHQNIDYNYNKNNDDDNVDKRIPLADELLEELKSKIPKPNYNNENDDKNLNTKSINDNVKKTNFAMKILNSTHKNGEHHILMSNNNIDNNNDNSLKTQRDKLPSKANTQSNGSLNYNYLNNKHTSTSSITSNESNTIEINRPMSMLELNDEIDQSIAQQYDNQSKIKNFRFESFRKERPRSKEHVQELVKFWDNTIIKSRQMKNNQDE